MKATQMSPKAFLFFSAIAALTAAVYWPGLNGPFVLDDQTTLSRLGALGGIKNWATFKAFVLSGVAGPSGRPLALASFVLDGTNWPTEAWPFKRTNLIIHIANGALIAVLTRQVLQLSGFNNAESLWVALFCAAAWLLHPFLVSTTLYAVQRMAQLAAMFMFSGMSLYIYGRRQLAATPFRGYLIISSAVAAFTALALLSKENGVLLPLLILLLEFSVVQHSQVSLAKPNGSWLTVFLVVPALLVLALLAKYGLAGSFFEPNPPRNFSTYERLLTESRVLADYLGNWFLPKLYTTGVFQDHYTVSTGITTPISTLLSLFLHAALLSIAVIWRKRTPLLTFSIAFFYAGHLLESTILNLELYFEHRNYLPAAFLFVAPVAHVFQRVPRRASLLAGTVSLLLLAGFTSYSARIWQTYESMVISSATAAPTSARAQQQLSMIRFNEGNAQEAFRIVDDAIEALPDRVSLRMWRAIMACSINQLTATQFEEMARQVARAPYDLRSQADYELLMAQIFQGKCPDVGPGHLRSFVAQLLANPGNADPARDAQLAYFAGVIEARAGEADVALSYYQRSLQSQPGVSPAMRMAADLAGNAHYPQAQALISMAYSFKHAEDSGEMPASVITLTDIDDFAENLRPYLDSTNEERHP